MILTSSGLRSINRQQEEIKSEKWYSTRSLALTASGSIPLIVGNWGGIVVGWPSCRGKGVPGFLAGGAGAVHAALWFLPAEICLIFLPCTPGIPTGWRCVVLCPSPNWPSELFPQPQTSPELVITSTCSAPTATSSTKCDARAGTWSGLFWVRWRPSGCPVRRSVDNKHLNGISEKETTKFHSIFNTDAENLCKAGVTTNRMYLRNHYLTCYRA